MAFKPTFMSDAEVTAGAVDYAGEITSFRFTPSSSVQEIKGLKPDAVYTTATSPSYTVVVGYMQDFETPESFANFLYDSAGEVVPVTFKLNAADTVSWTANVNIVPGDIGGEVDAYAVSEVTLGCDKPVKSTTP